MPMFGGTFLTCKARLLTNLPHPSTYPPFLLGEIMASNLGAFITQKTLMYMKERKKEKEGSTSVLVATCSWASLWRAINMLVLLELFSKSILRSSTTRRPFFQNGYFLPPFWKKGLLVLDQRIPLKKVQYGLTYWYIMTPLTTKFSQPHSGI